MRSASTAAAEGESSGAGVSLLPVYRGAHFQAVPCRDCDVPGYLILLPLSPSGTFSELGSDALASLGSTLATLEDTLLAVTKCERVYFLRLSEGFKSVHLHVFPRTETMASQFRNEMNYTESDLNGELLFYWARNRFKVDSVAALSKNTLSMAEQLRTVLASTKL